MYDNILVAIDMSEQSDRALLAARDIATLSGGKVKLLHVKETEFVAGKGGGYFNLEEPDEVEQLFKKDLAVLNEAGIPATSDLRHALLGRAADEIIEGARDFQADVIVMGCHGRSALERLLLGSTAYKVLRMTDRPILIVR